MVTASTVGKCRSLEEVDSLGDDRRRMKKGTNGEVLNIGTDVETSILDLAINWFRRTRRDA
jgi:hypothetical protein